MAQHLFDHPSYQNEHNALLTAWKDAAKIADDLEQRDTNNGLGWHELRQDTKDAITAAKNAYAAFMANLA